MVNEALYSDYTINQLIATENSMKSFQDRIPGNVNVILVNEGELNRISSLTTPNKCLAILSIPEIFEKEHDFEKQLIIGLDGISDPGNLGTIIRTADWFGIKTIICSNDCVDAYNPKVVQATMGAIFRVKIIYCDLEDHVNDRKSKIPIYGALMKGKDIFKEDLPDKALILFGNESFGLSKELESLVEHKITISNYSLSKKRSESLNVSSAVAIICAQFRSN